MKRWALATLIFGAATLVILVGFGLLPPVRMAYPNGDFPLALAAFQRAETSADLDAVFGAPANGWILAAMHAANALDLFLFIPAYTLFLLSASALIAGGARRPLFWLVAAPVLIGAAGDVMETATQLRMTANWARAADLLPLAPWYWLKYAGLALAGLGCAALCILSEPRRFILATLGVSPLVATVAVSLDMGAPPLMSIAFGGFWLALFAVAALELWRKR